MAKVQKELGFAERLTNALNAIEAAQEKVKEAQAEYESAKQGLSDELKELPGDHPLRLLTSSNGSHKAPVASGRTRSSKADIEGLRDSILSQLKDNGPLKKRDFDMGSVKDQTFMIQVAKLVEEGLVKKEGQKASTTYKVGK